VGEEAMRTVEMAEKERLALTDDVCAAWCRSAASHFLRCRDVLEKLPPSMTLRCEGMIRYEDFTHGCRKRVNYNCDVKNIHFKTNPTVGQIAEYANRCWTHKAFGHYLVAAGKAKFYEKDHSYAVALFRTAASNGCIVERGTHYQQLAIDSGRPIPSTVSNIESELAETKQKDIQEIDWGDLRLTLPIKDAVNPTRTPGILLKQLLDSERRNKCDKRTNIS
jgi:hypothetical protein